MTKGSPKDALLGLHAAAPNAVPLDVARSGKWLVFCSLNHHADVWETIRDATEAGTLGVSAKTSAPMTAAQRDTVERLVADGRVHRSMLSAMVAIYTYDCNDHADVARVLAQLRELGFEGRLSYKADADTEAGLYGDGTAMYVSQPGSLHFDQRRR